MAGTILCTKRKIGPWCASLRLRRGKGSDQAVPLTVESGPGAGHRFCPICANAQERRAYASNSTPTVSTN